MNVIQVYTFIIFLNDWSLLCCIHLFCDLFLKIQLQMQTAVTSVAPTAEFALFYCFGATKTKPVKVKIPLSPFFIEIRTTQTQSYKVLKVNLTWALKKQPKLHM